MKNKIKVHLLISLGFPCSSLSCLVCFWTRLMYWKRLWNTDYFLCKSLWPIERLYGEWPKTVVKLLGALHDGACLLLNKKWHLQICIKDGKWHFRVSCVFEHPVFVIHFYSIVMCSIPLTMCLSWFFAFAAPSGQIM